MESKIITQTEVIISGEKKNVLILKQRPRKVTWNEEVINNENAGRKSSKSNKFYIYCIYFILFHILGCCIYHKKKAFGESDSDESDSDVEAAEKAEPKPGVPKPYQRFHA